MSGRAMCGETGTQTEQTADVSSSHLTVNSAKTKKPIAGAGVVDKPLTFHSKIKSSGYATSSSRYTADGCWV